VTSYIRLTERGAEQHTRAEELRARAERVEAEVYLRSCELDDANRRLRAANDELEAFCY
jgi:hypothetical protein